MATMKIPATLIAIRRFPGRVVHGFYLSINRILRSGLFWILLILGVVALIVVYYGLANRYAPNTTDAYIQAFVVQVAPQVAGQVVRVPVGENELVKQGDLLFEIDPRPFEQKVGQLEASLAQAIQQIAQMENELVAAGAEQEKLAAELEFALAVHNQEKLIFDKDATTERKFLDSKQKHEAALASLKKARALVRVKEDALKAKIGSEHALVAEARALLATAKLNLEWTKVRAPAAGYVTDLQLRVGAFVEIGHPVLTCIESERWWIVANFRESNLQYLRAGQPAGIVFKSRPGQIYHGRVQTVGWGVDHGQGVPSGKLPAVRNPQDLIPATQRFQVRVVLDHPEEIPLRVGSTASVTVYTSPDFALNPVAEFWQDVESWLCYLR
jgi:multidrug resistance efflux pump